jgi:hypothetical protein
MLESVAALDYCINLGISVINDNLEGTKNLMRA